MDNHLYLLVKIPGEIYYESYDLIRALITPGSGLFRCIYAY